MGFPYGADEDAAYIIAWLELNKFNGLNSLVNSIEVVDNKYDGKINLNVLNNSSLDLFCRHIYYQLLQLSLPKNLVH
jgi:dUTPase